MNKQIATLAGGCFWCTEAVFKRLKGVSSVLPGYAGGKTTNPTYEQVCSGNTGHAESVQIEFDDVKVPYQKILEVFFYTHNPTTRNQQGNDVGTEYRSIVFFHSKEQESVAKKLIQQLIDEKIYKDQIVTDILPYTNFYLAESYHKNYYDRNQNQMYCSLMIAPKLKKLLEVFGEDVEDAYKIDSNY